MKFFTSLILTILCLYSCQKDRSNAIIDSKIIIPKIYFTKQSVIVQSNTDTVYFEEKKINGYLVDFFPNSKDTLSVEGYFNGLQSGISKKWFANGQVMEIRNYNNGQKSGKQIAFWVNGNRRFDFLAKNDFYEGVLQEWNSDGNLIHLGTYENGQEEGPQKLWYDNGKIRANYVIKNGKRYGLLGTKNCVNVSDSIFILQ